MRPPRVRFTVRRLMAAVVVASLVIVGEKWLYDQAVSVVWERPGGDYLRHEAVEVWIVLNLGVLFAACFAYEALRRKPPRPPGPE